MSARAAAASASGAVPNSRRRSIRRSRTPRSTSSRGIGRAISRALVAEGAHVAITGRSEGHLAAARSAIEGAGPGSVETLQADVRRFAEVKHAVDATVARFGGLDVLINNAGIGI